MLLLSYALGLQDDQIVDGLVEGVNLNVTGGQTPCVKSPHPFMEWNKYQSPLFLPFYPSSPYTGG